MNTTITNIVTIAAVAIAFGGLVLATIQLFKSQRNLSREYEIELDSGRQISAQDTRPGRDTYKILAKYSAQGLAQSRISFLVSIIFAGLGFIVILSGVGVAIFANKQATTALIPVISGAIVDAVAGLFFTVNARTQKVMVEFFDKLRSDQRVEDAMDIASKLPDTTMASKLQALLALNFTEMKDIPDLFRQLIEQGSHSPPNAT